MEQDNLTLGFRKIAQEYRERLTDLVDKETAYVNAVISLVEDYEATVKVAKKLGLDFDGEFFGEHIFGGSCADYLEYHKENYEYLTNLYRD